MDFEMPIVIDENVLEDITEKTKYYEFLFFWLQERQTKAVIIKSKWNSFRCCRQAFS